MNNDFENNNQQDETSHQPEQSANDTPVSEPIENNEPQAQEVVNDEQSQQEPNQENVTNDDQAQQDNAQNNEYQEQYTPENQQQEPQPNPWANQTQNFNEQKHYIPNAFNVNNQGGYYQPPVKNKKPNNGKKGFKIFVICLVAVVLFTVGAGVGRLAGMTNSSSSTSKSDDSLTYKGEDIDVNSGDSVKRDDIKPDENGKYTADQVAQLVGDSVVNIQVYSTTDSSVSATASGVILNKKGYIITNDHIYSSVTNAKFVVTMNDGTSYKASYVAGDQRSDIAVLKFDEVPNNLVAAAFANSSDIKAGDDVIAIGSPNGLSGTVTKGIVSYPSRRISASASSSDGQTTATYSMRVIQTDVALNPGNSGGALVNMYGQVVGISSSKIAISGYEGICFAIPSNDAVKYAKSLVKNGAVTGRAKLGITYTAVSSAAALVNDIPAGLRIESIDSSSELYSKGITTGDNGDIITKINGKAITSSDIALDIIDDSSAGDEVELTVYITSKKTTETFKVKLLEDTSNTSYKNEIPKSTTANPYGNGSDGNNGNYGNGNGNNNGGNDSGSNNDNGNGNSNSDSYGYQNPFSFGN